MAAIENVREKTLSLKVSPELNDLIERLAANAGKPAEEYVRQLLLDAIEDAEDNADADEVMHRVRSGEERTYSSEQVRSELGLED